MRFDFAASLFALVVASINLNSSYSFTTSTLSSKPSLVSTQILAQKQPNLFSISSKGVVKSDKKIASHEENSSIGKISRQFQDQITKGIGSLILASTLVFNLNTNLDSTTTPLSLRPSNANAADGAAIAGCLFKKCPNQLAKCVLNPKCLANVICINTCNSSPDETGCQIKCGDIFENNVVGEFNKCAVSDMTCVPQKQDDGSYPVPSNEKLVQKFDTSLFNGRWYITAGQNKLFDVFPCQVHFFTETAPGKFFGKLNWRIEEPDGEFFTRDALQRFVQDPEQPAHMINHDNEYLHYEDDWYIIDYEPDNNPSGTPPFALVYYRGSNDAWIGYGGVVVYTRDAKLPESLIPRLREDVKKINFDFDNDFVVTDNSCKAMEESETVLLREKFAGKVAIQTEKQIQQQAVIARGNSVNAMKAQKLFFSKEFDQAEKAFKELKTGVDEFEAEIGKDVKLIESEVADEIKVIEKEIEGEVKLLKK